MDDDIAKGRGGHPQRRRRRMNSWRNPRPVKKFLEHLAANCNVTRSAEAARLCPHGGYMRRLVDANLREQWALALREGRERLIEMMHADSFNSLHAVTVEGKVIDPAIRAYGSKLALTLIKLHAPTANGDNDGHGRGRKRAMSADELRASILEKLAEAHLRLTGPKAEE